MSSVLLHQEDEHRGYIEGKRRGGVGSGSGRGNDLGDLERDELEIILRLCVLGEHTSHYFMAHGGLGWGKGIIMPPALRGEQQRWMYVGRRKGKRACMVVVSFGRRPQERKSEGNGASAPASLGS